MSRAWLLLSISVSSQAWALSFEEPELVTGATTDVVVVDATPFQTVYLVASTHGEGTGACPALLDGSCLGVLDPFVMLGHADANGAGLAHISVAVPSSISDLDVWLQAVAIEPAVSLSAVVSTTLSAPVYPEIPAIVETRPGPAGERVTVLSPAYNGSDEADDCMSITATPTPVANLLVYPMHTSRDCSAASQGYVDSLLALDRSTLKVHELNGDGHKSEASVVWDAATERIYWPHGGNSPVSILDHNTMQTVADAAPNAGMDSSGVLYEGVFFGGSVNSPDPVCNTEVTEDPDCGAIFAIDAETGTELDRLDYDTPAISGGGTPSRFRTWVGGSVTGVVQSGALSLFVGGTSQYGISGDGTVGDVTHEFRYGCSVIQLDAELQIVGFFDPGVEACNIAEPFNPLSTAFKSAVAGEVVPGLDGVWAQYTLPNSDPVVAGGKAASVEVYKLDNDLNVECTYEFPSNIADKAARFYQAPTVGADGRAYVVYSLPDNPELAGSPRRAHLFELDPNDCSQRLLVAHDEEAWHSPTLLDDRYVTLVAGADLVVFDLHSEAVDRVIPIGPTGDPDVVVQSAPILVDGKLVVLDTRGRITVIEDSGFASYGDAVWPTFRGGADRQGLSTR